MVELPNGWGWSWGAGGNTVIVIETDVIASLILAAAHGRNGIGPRYIYYERETNAEDAFLPAVPAP